MPNAPGIVEDEGEWNADVDAAFDMRIAGVNHFTWMLKAKYQGRDVSPQIAASMKRVAESGGIGNDKGAKALHNDAIGYQLYQVFGRIPTCIAHSKEYLRFYQGHGVLPDVIPPLSIWETDLRYARHDAMWQQVDDFISGALPISQYMSTFGPDHATDIIENMVGKLGKPFFINTYNRGAVSNMPGRCLSRIAL